MFAHAKRRFLEMHSARAWLGILAATVAILLLLPLSNGVLAPSSALHLPDYLVPLFGKFLCFGIVALAMDLIWGFAGILSLGHGLFFALGGYAMGMYLMRQIGTRGVYADLLPAKASTEALCPTLWSSSTGKHCLGTGAASTAFRLRWALRSLDRDCSRWSSGTSPFAQRSKASTSPSLLKR